MGFKRTYWQHAQHGMVLLRYLMIFTPFWSWHLEVLHAQRSIKQCLENLRTTRIGKGPSNLEKSYIEMIIYFYKNRQLSDSITCVSESVRLRELIFCGCLRWIAYYRCTKTNDNLNLLIAMPRNNLVHIHFVCFLYFWFLRLVFGRRSFGRMSFGPMSFVGGLLINFTHSVYHGLLPDYVHTVISKPVSNRASDIR